ncbi:MAG: translation elongation factor Ts [Candidatus Moranbacteria bacterium]|nr:translation elongation factor Ts [Candidatus Moranbacteria bacterium]MDD3965164.1 translation elongation factor Ts [Candidatus Moranbacteria bacterium]
MGVMEQVKRLREMTGAGVVDVKKALDEAKGDEEQAVVLLRKRGQSKAQGKSDREAHEGIVISYIHSNNRIGVLLKLYCETDFVAINEEFLSLGHDIAMHIAAAAPQYVKPEEVLEELVKKERDIWKEQLIKENKPQEMMEKIMMGKETKFRSENALLTQVFIKDSTKTVGELLTEKIHKIGENIQIGGFVRYEI